jgi:hypothetical protein
MKSEYIRFLKSILIYSLVLALAAIPAWLLLPPGYTTPALPFLFFFFIACSLVSYHYLLRSMTERLIRFVNTFLLLTVVKLFLYAGVMIAYVLLNKADAVPFMLSFFILYLAYTIFEVVKILAVSGKKREET